MRIIQPLAFSIASVALFDGTAAVREVMATGGGLDPAFGIHGRVVITSTSVNYYASALQPDGKVVAVGAAGTPVEPGKLALTRLNTDGSVDTSFGLEGVVNVSCGGDVECGSFAVTVEDDGGIVVGGYVNDAQTGWDILLARFNPDGTLDTTLDGDGIAILPSPTTTDQITNIEIQPDRKILLVGVSILEGPIDYRIGVWRINPDGTPDSTFADNGTLVIEGVASGLGSDVAVLSDGRLLVAGYGNIPGSIGVDFILARLEPDGTPDATFGSGGIASTTFDEGNEWVFSMLLQSDGKAVLVGTTVYDTYNPFGPDYALDYAIARFNPDGTLDSSFSGDGKTTLHIRDNGGNAFSAAFQSDGKLLVGGQAWRRRGGQTFGIVRYATDGTLDPTFGVDGVVLTSFGDRMPADLYDLFVQADGRIVTVGRLDGGTALLAARYLPETCSAIPLPASACLDAPKQEISIQRSDDPASSRLRWHWARGNAFDGALLGDPATDTGHGLCTYDTVSGTPSLAMAIAVAPGANWRSTIGGGWKYDDASNSADGVRAVRVRAGRDGATRARLTARGMALPLPPPVTPTQSYAQDPSVIVQLTNGNGVCWTSEFDRDVTTTNDDGRFRAARP